MMATLLLPKSVCLYFVCSMVNFLICLSIYYCKLLAVDLYIYVDFLLIILQNGHQGIKFVSFKDVLDTYNFLIEVFLYF